ncbi:MAG: phosphoglycerate kinase [Anaerolineales bacterium]
MLKKTIRDIDVTGKRVLVRVDFNVPLSAEPPYTVVDDTRIRGALPTIRYLRDHEARVILCSHLGRPKNGPEARFSLQPVVPLLADLLGGARVQMAPDCVGPEVAALAGALAPGETLMLENTRFHPEEKRNDPGFARALAAPAEVFVNDAFGSAHRAHASTEGVAHVLPAVAGLLLERELAYLADAIATPDRPFVAIIGGAKVTDKIGVIRTLLRKADAVLIGGGMANTFFKARGLAVGDSLVEDEALPIADELLEQAGNTLALPTDAVVADAFSADAAAQVIAVQNGVPAGWRILDIGPSTVVEFGRTIEAAHLVVWNGPMGVFELAPFAAGTNAIAKHVADSSATTIVGGGDSVAALRQAGLADRITHISTGGGASLELLEGKVLPGVTALLDKE